MDFKRRVLGHSPETVSWAFDGAVSQRCQNDILERFEETGGVQTWRGRLDRARPRPTMNADMDVRLLQLEIDSPSASLAEHQQRSRWTLAS
eukprot:scaffold18543_cov140-Isochrysis_galbana.AAC.1